MKKNYFFSLWLRAFSCTTTMTMLFTALMALTFSTTKTFAQTLGTEYKVVNDIDKLVGIDPSAAYVAGSYNSAEPTETSKQLCLYNVGAKRFLSVGGTWGTHAALDNTPHGIWLEKIDDNTTDRFWVNNQLKGSGSGTHLGFDGGNSFYMDRHTGGNGVGACHFTFEQAPGYTEKNKVYYVKMTRPASGSKTYFVTAYPNNNDLSCNVEQSQWGENNANYKNQVWKVITKAEYYELAKANPANMEDVIDFSFLIKAADFRVNDSESSNWNATAEKDNIFFGDNKQYKTYNNRSTGTWGENNKGTYNAAHQQEYGKLFYTYARGAKKFIFYQDITVHKAGWYLLRCNGFTTQVNDKGRVSARLMMAMVTNKEIDKRVYSAATLNKLSVDDAKTLMGKDKDGQGAGRAFFDGKYENQVQVCLDDKDWVTKISETNPVTLRIGYYVGDDCVLKDGDVTCVDNFKLLYAGPRRDPELILDEDQTDLMYLTNAKDTYKNSVLHLNRTFKEGQWNSLILPVDLKFGQMKRTFGDDVKVAKLTSLENGVITFRTVEPQQDSEVMVKAFEPYIIKPTVLTDDKGLA